MTHNSPYTPGNTITNPVMFFGRTAEIAELTGAIRKGSSKALVGLRRIGKSSILYHLAHHTQLPDTIAITYLDLLDARYHTVPGLLGGIWQGLCRATNQRYASAQPAGMAGFTTAIIQMKTDGYQPVVCLDELERLMVHPEIFDRPFFEAWRALGSMGTLAFVTASRVRIADVVQHNGSTSPFTNIFTQLTLAGLDSNAARALLNQPFQRANRPAPPPAHVDYALFLGGYHPYFLHMAGDILWRMNGTNREQFRQQMETVAQQPMQQLWNDLSPTEQAAATRLATGKGAVLHGQHEAANLLQIGLAENGPNNQPRLFSDLLTEWLKDGIFQQTISTRPVSGTSPSASALNPSSPQTRPVYASAVIFLIGLVVISWLATQFGWGFFLVFMLLAVYLAFILVGDGKITGRDFLEMLDKRFRDFLGK